VKGQAFKYVAGYLLPLVLVFVLFFMPLSVPVFRNSADYSVFNPNWNGISKLATLIHEKNKGPIILLDPLDNYNLTGGTLLIIGPNTPYTPDEINTIKKYIKNGNTLLLADDYGTGNQILQKLAVRMVLSKHPLHDFFYDLDDRFIVIVRIEDPVLGRNVSKIITNEPSAIAVAENGVAYTSGVARIGPWKRRYPILGIAPYGSGRVVVLSDPDVFENSLFDTNKPFIENLVNYLPGPIYIDETHHKDYNLYTQGTTTIKRALPKKKAKLILTVAGLLTLLIESDVLQKWVPILKKALKRMKREKTLREIVLELSKTHELEEKDVVVLLRRMEGD